MTWITISRYVSCILGILALDLALPFIGFAAEGRSLLPQPSLAHKQASSDLPLPPRNPDSSSAGGRRDGTVCPQDAAPATTESVLTALSPASKPGLTLAERPTFLVYVPQTSTQTAEFSLRTSDDRGVYRTVITLDNTPGILPIRLPADAPPLAIGQSYIWSFNVICSPNNRLDDLFVIGQVQRIAENPTASQSLNQLTAPELVALYQRSGLWYDTLTLLFERSQTQPNDSITQSWLELLQLGEIGTMPSTASITDSLTESDRSPTP